MNRAEAGRLGAIASRQTHNKKKQDRITSYLENPSHCKQCDGILPYSRRSESFCGHSCAATYSNTRRESRAKLVVCPGCGTNTSNPKFCSNQCQRDLESEQRRQRILAGESLSPKVMKAYLIEQAHGACQICSIDSWLGKPILLILDHIDGDSSNGSLQNLRVICSNCDAQLPTYKSRNRGHGRHARKIRYAAGQSY
jgi:5-methylcytosine-specific restriction endonuclease McrA